METAQKSNTEYSSKGNQVRAIVDKLKAGTNDKDELTKHKKKFIADNAELLMTEIEEEERRSDNDNARLQKQREVVQKAFNEAKAKADAEAKAKADAEAKAKAAATK